jgi:hypothetical protein
MKTPLCPENPAAPEQLRPEKNDRSGIGVHYVDAFLKPLKAGVALPDGTRLAAKRRGLKITLTLGTLKGEGLLRRLRHGPAPQAMLEAALAEAGDRLGGIRIQAADGQLWLAMPEAKP